jgi:transposase InsO family protein
MAHRAHGAVRGLGLQQVFEQPARVLQGCRLVGLSRDAYRHPPVASTENQTLSEAIKTIALERRRFGYRRVHDLLRTAHPGVNHKRVYRLYRAADPAVRKRAKSKRPVGARTPLVAVSHVNATWSMDFVSDSLCNGRRLKCLTVCRSCTKRRRGRRLSPSSATQGFAARLALAATSSQARMRSSKGRASPTMT